MEKYTAVSSFVSPSTEFHSAPPSAETPNCMRAAPDGRPFRQATSEPS
jgi:hypothetical protein